jgi:hypothetical protein
MLASKKEVGRGMANHQKQQQADYIKLVIAVIHVVTEEEHLVLEWRDKTAHVRAEAARYRARSTFERKNIPA